MAIRKNTTARRREVRRTLKPQPKPAVAWLHSRNVVLPSLLFVVLAVLGSLIALSGQAQPRFHSGQIATQTVVSRVKFRAIDRDETRKQRDLAREQWPAVYVPNTEYLEQLRTRLDGLIKLAEEQKRADQIDADQRKALELTDATLRDLGRYLESVPVTNSDGKKETRFRATNEWREKCDRFISDLATIAVLEPQRAKVESSSETNRAGRIFIAHPTLGTKERWYNTIISVDDPAQLLRNNVQPIVNNFGGQVANSVRALVLRKPQATYLFDPDKTASGKRARAAAVREYYKSYDRGDVLIHAGVMISPFDCQVIETEHGAYLDNLGRARRWLMRAGSIASIFIIVLALWGYLAAYQPRVIDNPMRGLALVSLLLLCQAIAVFPNRVQPELLFATATFATLLATSILAIVYNQRFALAVGAILALIVTVSLGMSVGFAIVLLIGVGVAVSLLSDVRTRSKLVKVGLMAGAAMAVATWIVGLAEHPLDIKGSGLRIFSDSLIVLCAGVATGMFTQGILPVIERIFKVTTSMTLKDLNDPTHTLLRHLAEQAPGTYTHSLRMAEMGEAAAEAIGADGLMCRVGAMYHDIGKIHKPMYFVENQGGGPNRHSNLSPAMSLLIIVGHVKNGTEMGREYGLPSALCHFIESHHGATLVEYFYHAAKQKRQGEGKEAPTEFEFRYPGPKPTTKEAAIIMLCDGVEGAARTLPDPNPARIEQLVHHMAMKRLMDGQFDQCNLTLQDLHKIEVAITKSVCAIYHARIAYPSEQKQADRAGRPVARTGVS